MNSNSASHSIRTNIQSHQDNQHHEDPIESNLEIINQEKKKKWFERIGSILIFIIVLISYVTQSELSQIIQIQNDYQKPYLLLYLTHSSYLFILPLHLLIIRLFKSKHQFTHPDALSTSTIRNSILNDLVQLKSIFVDQYRFEDLNDQINRPVDLDDGNLDELENDNDNEEIRRINRSKNALNLNPIQSFKSNLPLRRFLIRSIQLTFLIALPSLSWFASVSLIDLTSVTAIYNTNAFFAYLFAICPSPSTAAPPTHRLLGTALALLGSLTYAGYEVWYKKLISLPDPKLLKQSLASFSTKAIISNSSEAERHSRDQEESTGLLSLSESQTERSKPEIDLINRSLTVTPQNILLHANFITSSIGFFTLTLLWIPIPFLHFFKMEIFELPSDTKLIFLILGMISMGVIFNAGFMVLLGLWGPVVASVGNLCTLVLVAISDLILLPNYHLNLSISIGCILISTAFIVLVIDLFHK
ncbi:uncharacterized protein MELLADRAFT_115093 [Melampsora larici-populina 98AG31]|uniref:EamA domain-containing protein n=1 Tax=Melampsora larici-populina (strain 98AG31 / pathotype 3-4-7) TaxID=747676 RepID=F4R573_MELLP|nr:uncharacterized protein MELLADRAFT_115093 [Melampsora larici-populina 98AG31]EGG12311.1 hypothetical protein MELLADRAFT_115093 [Melampsora larici-populina 98AG31]